MEKNADFRREISKCDYCNSVAVSVNKHGVAVCSNCKSIYKLQKKAHLRDYNER
jgi:ribosomal protein L37AE/L43A